METFYKSFADIRDVKYDGLIITGAPLGQKEFAQVSFWEEMKQIMEWSLSHVTSTMFLCWGVQAAMYHLYGINKQLLPCELLIALN